MKTVALLIGTVSAVHEDRVAEIEHIQSTPGVLWRAAAHSRFADSPPGASSSLNGVKGDWKASIEAAIADGKITRYFSSSHVNIPDEFDSAANWPQCAKVIGDIRDQSNCGCCWAFAGATSASSRMCINSNATNMMPLSAQDVCFCGSYDGCNGGFIEEPWNHIKRSGVVTGGQYQGTGPFGVGYCSDYSLPHCHHHGPQNDDPYPAEGQPGCPSASSPRCPSKCDSDASAAHSDFSGDKWTFSGETVSASGEREIQKLIMAGGPVETAFSVYSDFENYDGGIYHHVTGYMAGGHAVTFVGWGVEDGVKYWKVQNSWNPWWGEKGYFRILRGSNHCNIEDAVTASGSTATWHKMNGAVVV